MVLELSLGLRDRSHEVLVAGMLQTDEYQEPRYARLERAFLIRPEEYRWPWGVPDMGRRLRRLATGRPFDVMAVHTPTAAVVAAAAGIGIPTFWVLHGYGDITRPPGPRMLARRLGDRWAYRRLGRRVIVVDGAMRAAAAHHLAAREDAIDVVRNGVDLGVFTFHKRAVNAPPVICMVGTLAPVKRVHHGIHAFATVVKRIPSAKLQIVGEGSERPALEALIRELDLTGSVELLGRRGDVPTMLRSARVFWQLSSSEGLPVAIIEAMATGLPVVATDVRGINSVVEHGQTGYLVDLDTYDALVSHTVSLLSNPSLGERLGSAGRERVEREFSVARMVSEYERRFGAAA